MTLSRQPVSSENMTNMSTLRRVILKSDPVKMALVASIDRLPEETPTERGNCIFYADDGGLLSSDENGESKELYFIGIIDILTPYNFIKRVEHGWKSLSHDHNMISAVNPRKYGNRFLDFMMKKVIRVDSLDIFERTPTTNNVN